MLTVGFDPEGAPGRCTARGETPLAYSTNELLMDNMEFSEWESLTDSERENLCQQLSLYDDWQLFKSVESAFLSQYGDQKGFGKVFCGLASGLGPLNAITVEIIPGQTRTKLPKRFLGFPVFRSYTRK